MKSVVALKPNFHFYFGSETTPPCLEQTYHMVVDKPLKMAGCQFKLLRDNSLFSKRAKEIHARLEQPLSDRPIYSFGVGSFRYIPNINGLYPQGYNKYLLLHGYGYKNRKGRRGGRGGRGRGGRGSGDGDDWLDELNCDLPKENEQDKESQDNSFR